ncbi:MULTISPECIES: tetratricopeptide repeat protein [Bradyrhizobium]|uniref:tetratricopeptide repeat protein n=1 Tax=Bradyrhizobium TaxID=374 RepID=UPI00293F6058|nr:tetratricopeptide repeat protein [Bradyrhizobium sp. NDS-1]WOH74221.1 tetratricopeptide repeat protein [Bradyrhizobium sp. NDS-1]
MAPPPNSPIVSSSARFELFLRTGDQDTMVRPDRALDMRFVALAFACLLVFAMPANANDTRTFNAMVALANRGDAEAQYHVGMMHNNGIGTQQDRSQAFQWFQKSAAADHPLGAYKLGCYYDGQGAGVIATDSDQALKYKLVSAKAGYARAQHDVAVIYDRQGNSEEALKWWKMAGDQGLPEALFSLARAYSAGKGTPRDLSLSYAYFKLSKVAPPKNVNEMASTLAKPELEKAEKLVAEWKPQPTALTLKAFSGFRAAEEHLKVAKQVF